LPNSRAAIATFWNHNTGTLKTPDRSENFGRILTAAKVSEFVNTFAQAYKNIRDLTITAGLVRVIGPVEQVGEAARTATGKSLLAATAVGGGVGALVGGGFGIGNVNRTKFAAGCQCATGAN
jgi:hypothetical protein